MYSFCFLPFAHPLGIFLHVNFFCVPACYTTGNHRKDKQMEKVLSFIDSNHDRYLSELKELLAITDGNLASHIKALEESGTIKVQKGFIGRKTNTTYAVTKSGEKAFKAHIAALEKMIKATK